MPLSTPLPTDLSSGLPSQSPTFLPQTQWLEVVRCAPLVSIDLLVHNAQGEVLLGWRNNKPAQACWFVPGGVVRKNESLQAAFERVVLDELGNAVHKPCKRENHFLGVYEHHYPDNFADEPGLGTHYVVLAHRLRLEDFQGPLALPTTQHRRYTWMHPEQLVQCEQVHSYTQSYFNTQPIENPT